MPLDYPNFKEHCKVIAIVLDDARAIQQIGFTKNLAKAGNTPMFLFWKIYIKRNYKRLQKIYCKSFVRYIIYVLQ